MGLERGQFKRDEVTTPKEILVKYNIRPLKRFGQSFLIDPNIINRIVASAGVGPEDTVVEIGAGAGIMTGMLCDRAREVFALEVDGRMIGVLKEELGARSNVTVMHQDVLTYDFSEAFRASTERPLVVVGNIPYNISSQILLRLIKYRHILSTVVLMFQKEVAERIIARPGAKQYSILSVLTLLYFDCKRIATVSPGCFYPKPRIDSTVLKMTSRVCPLAEVKDPEVFQAVVRAAFSKRRKTLANSMKNNPFLLFSDTEVFEIMSQADIDQKRRGETLTIEEFARMSNVISSRPFWGRSPRNAVHVHREKRHGLDDN